jgi:acyl-CoA thioester hydrolase
MTETTRESIQERTPISAPIKWDAPAPHVRAVEVQPQHIDLMQHVNNVNYLQWLEDVAWDHSRSLGLSPDDYTRLGTGVVVRRHELDYLAPALLGDRVLCATWITALDRLSLHRRFQFVRERDGTTLLRGATHYVCVEIASGKVRRMPAPFSEVYARGLAQAAAATSISTSATTATSGS